MEPVCTSTVTSRVDDEGYDEFLASLRRTFTERTASVKHLFFVQEPELFSLFLDGLPPDRRQHYTCHCCRHFVERFGAAVTIAPDGTAASAMWDSSAVPPFFAAAVRAVEHRVRRAEIAGVMLKKESQWGTPETGPWRHMSVFPRFELLCPATKLQTPDQIAAEKAQDRDTLQRALADFSIDLVRKAKALLETDNLYRGDKCLGVAKWLLDLQERLAATRSERARGNLIWLAAASAPAGFCHVRSSMIGTLLTDMAAGMNFDELSRRFAEKMDPLKYRRTTAMPADGQIAEAEKIIAKLGVAASLSRRFATVEDLQRLWRPQEPSRAGDPQEPKGIFWQLKSDQRDKTQALDAPAVVMTWDKFSREVLPKAERIELMVPFGRTSFVAFVTAADPQAPPIVQWDRPDRRNPVSWYMRAKGSFAREWNMRPGEWRTVDAVVLSPSMWDPEHPHPNHPSAVTFVLQDARDLAYSVGAGLFTELLRSEFHAIRATIEAHVKMTAIAAPESGPPACGLCLEKAGGGWSNTFRVTSGGMCSLYTLDRWD